MKKNTFIKFSISGAVVLVSIMSLSLVVNAAKKTAIAKPAAKAAPTATGDKAKVVAQIGKNVITVADLEERINKQIPFIRKRYTDEAERKKFLDSIVDFEVLALEAQAKGLDKKPEVVKALRKVMIHRQRQTILDTRVKLEMINDAEVKSYYDKHLMEFKRPERRRAALIVTKTKEEATKVADEVKKTKGNLRQFQQLVKKHSIDAETKKRGGLLPFFDKESKKIEKSIIETTFNLKKAGDVSQIITTQKGFAIIRLSGVSPKVDKPVEAVSELIKKRLLKDKQQKAFKDYIAELRSGAKIAVFEDKLDLVKIDATRRTMGRGLKGPGGKFRKMPGGAGMGYPMGRPRRMGGKRPAHGHMGPGHAGHGHMGHGH